MSEELYEPLPTSVRASTASVSRKRSFLRLNSSTSPSMRISARFPSATWTPARKALAPSFGIVNLFYKNVVRKRGYFSELDALFEGKHGIVGWR